MGAHTGSLGAMATSLREHWFKEYMADSNTPGNIDLRNLGCTARDCDRSTCHSKQLLLTRKRLIDRRLHRLDSTLNRGGVRRFARN